MWLVFHVVSYNRKRGPGGHEQSLSIVFKLVPEAHELSVGEAHEHYGLVQGALKGLIQFTSFLFFGLLVVLTMNH